MSVRKIESKELQEMLPDAPEFSMNLRQSKFQESVFGTFSANGFFMPKIQAVNLWWNTKSDLLVHEPEDTGNMIDFSFITQGRVASEFSAKEYVMVESQHNFKYSPGRNHKHKFAKQEELRVFQISIEKDFFAAMIGCEDKWSESILGKLEREEPFFGSNSTLSVTPVMKHLIGSLNLGQDQSSIANLRRQSVLFELIATQLEQIKQHDLRRPAPELSLGDQEKLYALHAYLQQHFLDDLNLHTLSRISTLNEFKLKKGFRALFNTSVIAYVKELRMEYASRLLRDDRKTIEEVAGILGYEYANHFSAAFKKHFGISPSSWI